MSLFDSAHILIVDDLADNLFLLQVILEAEGYIVISASDGTSALAAIQASSPDLVLLDVMMPDLDGFEVTRRIRQNPQFLHLPILLVTAHADLKASNGLNIGADDFIRKPIDPEELLIRVEAALRLKQRVETHPHH